MRIHRAEIALTIALLGTAAAVAVATRAPLVSHAIASAEQLDQAERQRELSPFKQWFGPRP